MERSLVQLLPEHGVILPPTAEALAWYLDWCLWRDWAWQWRGLVQRRTSEEP